MRLSFFATLLLYASNDLQGNFEKFLPCFVTERLPPQKDGVLISLPAAERIFEGGKPDSLGQIFKIASENGAGLYLVEKDK